MILDIENEVKILNKRISSIEKNIDYLIKMVKDIKDDIDLIAKGGITGSQGTISKALNESLIVIRNFEKKQKRGIRAAELANLRNLSPPSIYEQLNKLEEAKQVLWLRGREIGLTPSHSKFYTLKNREESLWETNVIMELSDEIASIGRIIRDEGEEGISKEELIVKYSEIKGLKLSKNISKLEEEITKSIHILLRRVLINKEIDSRDNITYTANIIESKS